MLRQVYGVELILRLKVSCVSPRVILATLFSTVLLQGKSVCTGISVVSFSLQKSAFNYSFIIFPEK